MRGLDILNAYLPIVYIEKSIKTVGLWKGVNYRTGEAAAVMVNQNPGVDQSESGVEWLINNG